MDLGEILALILLIFGTALGGIVLWKIFDIVRSSIKGNNSQITAKDFDRLAQAFMKHKKEIQERVQNIEAVIAEEENTNDYSKIEEPDNRDKLTNDLQKKDNKNKIRS